ncbi:acyltransferase family protein [Planosporangium sp. 12N6]|uniref:acyltransferase family protein n=1 Tax=Planosporangium spinosum TaxID=3402278 RepID=UPI003CF6BE57
MGGLSFTRSRGSLAELYSGRDNGIGFIRLMLAVGVVLSHSKPLGFGAHDLGYYLFNRQTNIGTMAVYGFFVLSGLLITRSARRASIGRYAWHRALRILPALWVCLAVTALVVAPLVALREHGNLNGFWHGPNGPFNYITANMWTGLRQVGIHDLLAATTPWGRHTGGSVFDGALWSLAYEMLCYIIIGLLAVTGVLQNARRFVLLLTVATYGVIVMDYWQSASWTGPVAGVYTTKVAPLLGGLSFQWIVYLGFLFLLGGIFDLYRERIPIHDGLGVASAIVFVGTLLTGGFFVLGLPAFAYLLIWLSVRMPRRLHWVGRKNDYSYGIYIYGFVGQQVFASLGYSRWGYVPFAAISLVAAFVAAYLSWHLVERHALALKGWAPRIGGNRPTPPETGEGGSPERAGDPALLPTGTKV